MSFIANLASNRELIAKLEALDKSQAVIEFDLDGKILIANTNFLGAVGYTLQEIEGKHHSMFVDAEYAKSPEYKKFWADLKRGEFQSGQFHRLGKGGKEIWIEASYNPLLDRSGKPYKVVKFATDITRQKIQDAEYAGKIAAIGKSQAVIEFNLDGTILTANANFLTTLGYTLDEIKGKHHSMFADEEYRTSSDYREFWAKLNRGEFQAGQYRRIGKGGKEIWIEASYNPIFDLGGKPYKVVKFATDITPRKKATAEISIKVNQLVGSMSASATQMQSTAETLAAAAEETSAQSKAVVVASEQLTSAVSEISRQLSESTRVVDHAVEETSKSETMVGGLIEVADKIGNVSNVVATIAGQTNLLALNATIEAARAGDAGKGFAVVASEVKSLANQTARATDEIGQQVQGIQNSSQQTAGAIKSIASIMTKISEISTSISSAVEQQSAATREVSTNIESVTKAAEETGQASVTLLTVSRDIAERTNELSREFAAFMKII